MSKKIDVTTIGGRIKGKRVLLGYSQEQLAEKMNITAALVSNYENNKVDIKLSSLRELAGALNTTVGYLADGEPEIDAQMQEMMKVFAGLKGEQVKEVAIKQMKVLGEMGKI